MKKKNISLILNSLIVILEIIGFMLLYRSGRGVEFQYYTEDSNILGLISSLLFIMFIISKKRIPRWLSLLKYISAICLALTFFVVIFILIPMADFNFSFYLFEGSMLFQHLLCPILVIITFVFFDDLDDFTFKDNMLGLCFTFIYTIVLVILNICDVVKGPYPFLMVKNQSIAEDIFWAVGILGFAYVLAYILRLLYAKYNKKIA